MSHIELRFARLFEIIPRTEFRVLVVVREPIDWLGSLYRSHKSVHFEGHPLDTSKMSMLEFLTKWRFEHPDHCLPQAGFMEDLGGRFAVDFLLRFEHLDNDFKRACSGLGLPSITLDQENLSVDIDTNEELPASVLREVSSFYAADQRIWQFVGGRWLTPYDKAEIDIGRNASNVPRLDVDSPSISSLMAEISSSNETRRARPLTRDDVFWAFRMLLGRDPESETIIEEHRELGTREALRRTIMASREFTMLYSDIHISN